MQPDNQQLDPSIVALTKSIGQAESGGKYKAPTGGAQEVGAYQMTPAFIQNYAPKYGIDPNSVASDPASQDKLAYNVVKEWGTTGNPAHPELGKLTPAQIASAWNSGDPNAYTDPEYGKNNAYGSTQNYVNKISEYYKQNFPQSEQSSQPTSESKQPDWLQSLEGLLGMGAGWVFNNAKPIAATGLMVGGATLGESIGGPIGGAVGAMGGSSLAGGLGLMGGGNGDNTQGTTMGTSDQQPNNQNQFSMTPENQQSTAASMVVKDALTQLMQGNVRDRNLSNSPEGKSAINTSAAYNLVSSDENGNAVFDEQKRLALDSEIEKGLDAVVASQKTKNSPMAVSNYAGSFLGNDRFLTPDDKQKAAHQIKKQQEADNGGIKMSEGMPLERMRDLVKRHNAAAHEAFKKMNYSISPEMVAHKALSHAYNLAIHDKVSKEDLPLYDRLKKSSQDLNQVKNLKKHIQGKRIPKNKGMWESFLRQGARAAEIYIGDKLGGPIGAIIGGMVGEHFNNRITSHFGRHIFDTPGMKAALDVLHHTRPKEYDELMKALKERGAEVHGDTGKQPTTQKGLIKEIKKDEATIGKVSRVPKPLPKYKKPGKEGLQPPRLPTK